MRPVYLSVALAMLSTAVVEGELLLVYSIQRHGARNVLPKSSVRKKAIVSTALLLLLDSIVESLKIHILPT